MDLEQAFLQSWVVIQHCFMYNGSFTRFDGLRVHLRIDFVLLRVNDTRCSNTYDTPFFMIPHRSSEISLLSSRAMRHVLFHLFFFYLFLYSQVMRDGSTYLLELWDVLLDTLSYFVFGCSLILRTI